MSRVIGVPAVSPVVSGVSAEIHIVQYASIGSRYSRCGMLEFLVINSRYQSRHVRLRLSRISRRLRHYGINLNDVYFVDGNSDVPRRPGDQGRTEDEARDEILQEN